jgi:hypothetical protein
VGDAEAVKVREGVADSVGVINPENTAVVVAVAVIAALGVVVKIAQGKLVTGATPAQRALS